MAMAKDLHQTLIKLADSKRQPILAKENNNVVGSDTSIQNTESSSSNTSYGGEELTTTATGLEYWTFKSKQGRYVREIWG